MADFRNVHETILLFRMCYSETSYALLGGAAQRTHSKPVFAEVLAWIIPMHSY